MNSFFNMKYLAPLAFFAAIALPSLASAGGDCVSGPLCGNPPPRVVNPILQGITVDLRGFSVGNGFGEVVKGKGEAGGLFEGGIETDLSLVFSGSAGICPDDPNCEDVNLDGYMKAFGKSMGFAKAVDPNRAEAIGGSSVFKKLQVQVLIGNIEDAD